MVSSPPDTPSVRARGGTRVTSRDLAQIAVFAALIAALGLAPGMYLGPAVPITLQTLGVMLTGAIIGARNGCAAVLLCEVLVAMGLPLLSGGRGGIAVFAGPSAGYLIGWLAGVIVIGTLTVRLLPKYPALPALAVTALGGIIVIYTPGIGWTAITTGSLWAAIVGAALYLPGDIAKVITTVLVATPVHRAWPGLIHRRSAQRS